MSIEPKMESQHSASQASEGVVIRETFYTWADIRRLVKTKLPQTGKCWGVPRGGAVVAALTGREVDTPAESDFIVDDIIDSGRTMELNVKVYNRPFHALIDKREKSIRDSLGWVHFPWEPTPIKDAEENVVRLLEHIGEDPTREGLRDTPRRVISALHEMTQGYHQDPKAILATDFPGHGYDEMVICRNIEFYSLCEHHLLPFSGVAHVAYVPNDRVVGLSKLARLVDCFARRLQIQEKLTQEIAQALEQAIQPKGVGVTLKAHHLCMSCRGVKKHKAQMLTTCLYGVFRNPEVRAEYFAHCNGKD